MVSLGLRYAPGLTSIVLMRHSMFMLSKVAMSLRSSTITVGTIPDAAEVNAALRGAEDMLKILDARQQLGPYNRYGWTASPWYSFSPYWKR